MHLIPRFVVIVSAKKVLDKQEVKDYTNGGNSGPVY